MNVAKARELARGFTLSPRSGYMMLALASLLFNGLVLAWLGIQHGGDTPRYLGGANNLLAGHPLAGKQVSYAGYVAVVAASKALGANTVGVVALQIGVAVLAAFAIFNMGRHPLASCMLAAGHVTAELLHIRPFYSTAHNALVLSLLLPVYVLAVLGFVRWRADQLVQLVAAVVASQLLVVAVTFADWDGRFLLYVLPLIILIAGCEAVARYAAWHSRPDLRPSHG